MRALRQTAMIEGESMPNDEKSPDMSLMFEILKAIRADLADVKADVNGFKAEVKAEFSDLRVEMREGFEAADRRFGRIEARLDKTATQEQFYALKKSVDDATERAIAYMDVELGKQRSDTAMLKDNVKTIHRRLDELERRVDTMEAQL